MFSFFRKKQSSTKPPPNPDPQTESASHKKRGDGLLAQGQLDDAAQSYRQALSFDPNHAEANLNLGFVLKEQAKYEEAEHYLNRAVQTNPRLEDAYYILGTVAQIRGNLDRAIRHLRKAIDLKPDFEIVYRELCHALFLRGQHADAKKTIQQGIALFPESSVHHSYLGILYFYENDYEQAVACFSKAIQLQPGYVGAYTNLGHTYFGQGNIDAAMDSYQKALSLDPDSTESLSCLLFARNYDPAYPPADYLADARYYGDKAAAHAQPYAHWAAPQLGCDHAPLRIGLVSGDLGHHPVGFFLESILAHLNPERVTLAAYPTQPIEDEVTARLKPHFALWKPIAGLTDEASARLIHEDGIDILIDLAGHTAHNRLTVFAWKPAPVQVSWLGYFASTGMPGIDYLLADPVSVPESHRADFTETVWYLPDTRLCFTPPAAGERLTPAPPPALRDGCITFGCFQNVGKVTDAVLAAWARIFQSMPDARLRFQSGQMNYPTVREQLLQRLVRVGIALERVSLIGPVPREAYLAAYNEVDIILDTFPYTGGTTTCEALWMGVPTLTLAGKTMIARQGASLLTCAGLTDWIAEDEGDYVARALRHASAVERLAELRSGLRPQVLASPLFDAPRFAHHLEEALYSMWQRKLCHGPDK